MTEQYDPQASYDFLDPEGIKIGELRQGRYFEGDWEVGLIDGAVFHYNGAPAGRLDGLTVTRDDPPGQLTKCQLMRQE